MSRYRKGYKHNVDPFPYQGATRRVDGSKPYNGYFWPTDQWLASDVLGHIAATYDWRIDLFALEDGRWATDGFAWRIDADHPGNELRCCFPSRADAMRAQIDRISLRAREANRPDIEAWARSLVDFETDDQADLFARIAA